MIAQKPKLSPAQIADRNEVQFEDEDLIAAEAKYGRKGMVPPRRGTGMLVVTTFCKSDIWLLMKRQEFMTFLGVQPTHDLLLVADSDVTESDLAGMATIHRGLFKNVFTWLLKGQSQGAGWPRGTNQAFRNTVRLLHGQFPKFKFDTMPYRGWYYFESDITPLTKDFLPMLNNEFIQARKPFMGVIGEIKTNDNRTIRHMNGSGIYPFGTQFFTESIMLVESVPWDVAGLQGTMLKTVHDLGHTRYSMHFSTTKYQKLSDRHYSAIKTPHGKPAFPVTCDIFPTHLIHHGCKDASLMDDLMGKTAPIDIQPSEQDYLKAGFENAVARLESFKKKRRAKKHAKAKKEKFEPSSPDVIRLAHKNGMKWKDLIKNHHVMPAALKKILEG